ncbi:MAG: hypothetical protein ACTSQO_05925 [Candidatus Helarchaeota archaeon]
MNKVSLAYKIIAVIIYIFSLFYCYYYLGIFNLPAWTFPSSEDPFNTPGISSINFFNGILYFFYYVFSLAGAYFYSMSTYSIIDLTSIKFYGDNFFVSCYYTIYFSLLIFSLGSLIYYVLKDDQKFAFYAFLGPILVVILGAFHNFLMYILSPNIYSYLMYITPLFGFLSLIFIVKGFTRIFKGRLRSIFYFLGALYFISILFVPIGSISSLSYALLNLYNTSPLSTGVDYFINPLFIGSLLLFLFLELAFQSVYIQKIGDPAIERAKKIDNQLKNLESQVKEYESRVKSKIELHSMSIRRKFSSEAFDFIREVAETGALGDEEKSRMEINTMREYSQLQNYLENLYNRDPESEIALKAHTARPSLKKIAINSTVWIIIKLFVISLLTFLCFNPLIFFTIMGSPSSILGSIEINLIEICVMIIAPLALLFPAIALIIDIRRKKFDETHETEKEKASLVQTPIKTIKKR